MEHNDGAKRPKLSDDSDEDRLSALPDDILIKILVELRSGAAVAARTSVLSRRWRGLWALLPELHFPVGTEPHRMRSVLTAHEAPTIHSLVVHLRDADPESVATWLPVAVPRLSGDLFIFNSRRDEAVDGGAVELPYIERATRIWLKLDGLGLTLPPSGVFGRLTDLRLLDIRLHGPCRLGDIVSSPRCPSLRKLFLQDVRGLGNFVVHSESLQEIEMNNVLLHSYGDGIVNIRSQSLLQLELKDFVLRKLTIVAPALRVLKESCYMALDVNPSEPVAKISAPQLMSLQWKYYCGPRSIQFDMMAQLLYLYTSVVFLYMDLMMSTFRTIASSFCSASNLSSVFTSLLCIGR
jgi:hypothetical protein